MSQFTKAFVSSIAVAVLLVLAPFDAGAQETNKVHRIGFLTAVSPSKTFKLHLAALRQGLRELGYVEGKNIVIEERYAKGKRKRLPALAAELVQLKSDVIVTHGGSIARIADQAVKKAGMTIPVVFASTSDPIGYRIVASLAKPGGNITGLSSSSSDLVAKRLELLKEVVPSASRIAVFWNPAVRHTGRQLKTLQAAAPGLGVTLVPIVFAKPNIDSAFDALRRERPDALNVLGWGLVSRHRKRIAEFAPKNRLPTMQTGARGVASGGLMSYGSARNDMYHRAATYIDKILKGTKPADLPVEQPTRFYLTVNLKTAKGLGITIPPSILLRATEVIE